MPETIVQQCNPTETKVVSVIAGRARLVLEVFLAGTGLMLWISVMFFNPMNDVKTELKLIQQDLTTVKTNELVHVQAAINKIEARNAEADKLQTELQINIAKILTLLQEEKK